MKTADYAYLYIVTVINKLKYGVDRVQNLSSEKRRQMLFVVGNRSEIDRVDRFSEESNQSKKGRLIDKVDRVDRPFRQVDRWRRLGRFRGLVVDSAISISGRFLICRSTIVDPYMTQCWSMWPTHNQYMTHVTHIHTMADTYMTHIWPMVDSRLTNITHMWPMVYLYMTQKWSCG